MNIFRNERLAVGILILALFFVCLCGLIAPDLLKRVIAGTVPGLFLGHGLSLGGEVRSIRNTVFAVFMFIALVER